jgi:hypothetical protein
MKPTLHPPGDLGEAFRLHRADLVRLAAFIVGDRGTVDGVVQEVRSGVPDTGFALTASYVQADAKAAASATAPVSTQGCTH